MITLTPSFFIRWLVLLLSINSLVFAKCDLAVCTIFQNDADYLKEWIEFHKIQGVKHFYLYNNNSKDDFQEVLKPYITKKEVTLIEWPYTYEEGEHGAWLKIQRNAYMDCIDRFGTNANWLAFIDTDEFLFSPKGKTLNHYLKQYKNYGGICVNWLNFGTSYIDEIPSGELMIQLLFQCEDIRETPLYFVKSIVQPKYVQECKSAHAFVFKEGKFAVTVDKNESKGDNYSPNLLLDKIRINHYWSRTEKYLREYKIPSRQKRRSERTEDRLLEIAEKYNKSSDTAIQQYVPALRRAMGYE